MNEDVKNLIEFHQTPTKDINEGDIGIYYEGIVKAKVRVVSAKILENGHDEYEMEVIENMGRFKFPKRFTCGGDRKFRGYCWSFRKEEN